MLKFRVYNLATLDFGQERTRFLCNALDPGKRNDDVEIQLEGEENHPARLLFFAGRHSSKAMDTEPENPTDDLYAVVMYYQISTWNHPIINKPRCRRGNPRDQRSFHIINIESIVGHAHIIPDFDDPTETFFFWDKVVTSDSNNQRVLI